ncbi:MAG: HAD family hydrolase, partial [Thermoanaerobaculia bacterium]
GTLLRIGRRSIHRELPRALGASRKSWAELVREGLLTRAFPDPAAFVAFICDSLAPGHGAEVLDLGLSSVRSEVASVSLFPGVLSLLHFLKRRGLRLGLVSNLTSPHTEPVKTLGLAGLFDATLFSCDEGMVKPQPEIYRRVCARLGVPPERTLFVGDSRANDVDAPAALGMWTAGIGFDAGSISLTEVADLGRLSLSAPAFKSLMAPGWRLELGGQTRTVTRVAPVGDDEQGRYNLVYALDCVTDGGAPSRLFAKRFLLPETAYVEELGYALQRACGLPACDARVEPGLEPLLILSAAPGRKLEGAIDPGIAFDIGRHFAFGFLFANADLRPRNSFRFDGPSGSRLSVVDMEHCLFNLAIDTEGLADPFRPETFDSMGESELSERVKKRVLSQKTSSRARRSFLGEASRDSEVGRAYSSGFQEFAALQRERADALCDLISRRIHRDPPLVIGTQAHRRAMAEVDLLDIRSRLEMEPEAALEWMW